MQVPPVLPIDLTAIVAIVMGISIILIPVAGLTLRFAIKPAVEALQAGRRQSSLPVGEPSETRS